VTEPAGAEGLSGTVAGDCGCAELRERIARKASARSCFERLMIGECTSAPNFDLLVVCLTRDGPKSHF
jgi:hypothetical protein